MKKILYFLSIILLMPSCADFLDETPNKTGSSIIYHIDQLNGLMGNPGYYTGTSLWNESIVLTDDCVATPYFYSKGGVSATFYGVCMWDIGTITDVITGSSTWRNAYSQLFPINTTLEYVDIVEQRGESLRKQVKAEALFARAHIHFALVVMYSRWEDSAPGIGYKEDTSPDGIPSRETVKYTLGRIEKDLTEARKLLSEAGRTDFEVARNYRPTVPAVDAMLARFYLYRGDYAKALSAANSALLGHSTLKDFINDELYTVYSVDNIPVLDSDGNETGIVERYEMTDLTDDAVDQLYEYPELYIRQTTDVGYANKGIPISKGVYDLFDKEKDERWKRFYGNNYNLVANICAKDRVFTFEEQQNLEEWEYATYLRFHREGYSDKFYLSGLSTAEMYLIKAECLARSGDTNAAQQALWTLRRTRFADNTSAESIAGNVQDVLDERRRELGAVFRFYDLKRLNGAENAAIVITKERHEDFGGGTLTVQPNDPRYAIGIPIADILTTGWEQNEGWE